MATLGRFSNPQSLVPRTPSQSGYEEPLTPAWVGAFRRQPVVLSLRRRPGWKSWLSYGIVAKPDITTPPQVHSTIFQPRSRNRSQWITPGNEPWWSWAGNTGEWFRAHVPNLSLPGNAQQQSMPRFGYVWNWPGTSTKPTAQPLRSSKE